jgi:ABC-type phosphate transport system ATPase subunit
MDTPLEQSPILALMSEYTKTLDTIAMAEKTKDADLVSEHKQRLRQLAMEISELQQQKRIY